MKGIQARKGGRGPADWSRFQLRRLYSRFDRRALALLVFSLPVFWALWWALLHGVISLAYPDLGPGGLLARPSSTFMVSPSFCAALVTAYWFSRWVMARALGRHFPGYLRYRRLGLGFDGAVVFKAFTSFTAILIGLVIYLQMNDFAALTPDRMVINDWRHGAVTYAYDDIAEVREIQPQRGGQARYEIEFYDGRIWQSGGGLRHPNPVADQDFAYLAASLSGRRVVNETP